MRPIDADALTTALDDYQHHIMLIKKKSKKTEEAILCDVKGIINSTSTIGEQKKGKWIVTGTFDDFLKCSYCGYKKPWNEDIFNFCPKCGVEMKICDDVSNFQPVREDVEKAFEMFKKRSETAKKIEGEK